MKQLNELFNFSKQLFYVVFSRASVCVGVWYDDHMFLQHTIYTRRLTHVGYIWDIWRETVIFESKVEPPCIESRQTMKWKRIGLGQVGFLRKRSRAITRHFWMKARDVFLDCAYGQSVPIHKQSVWQDIWGSGCHTSEAVALRIWRKIYFFKRSFKKT